MHQIFLDNLWISHWTWNIIKLNGKAHFKLKAQLFRVSTKFEFSVKNSNEGKTAQTGQQIGEDDRDRWLEIILYNLFTSSSSVFTSLNGIFLTSIQFSTISALLQTNNKLKNSKTFRSQFCKVSLWLCVEHFNEWLITCKNMCGFCWDLWMQRCKSGIKLLTCFKLKGEGLVRNMFAQLVKARKSATRNCLNSLVCYDSNQFSRL